MNPHDRNSNLGSGYKVNYATGNQNQKVPDLFSKGVDVKTKQTYDYNILNGQSLSQKQQLSARQ